MRQVGFKVARLSRGTAPSLVARHGAATVGSRATAARTPPASLLAHPYSTAAVGAAAPAVTPQSGVLRMPEEATDEAVLNGLLSSYKPGWSLPPKFYNSESIHRMDMKKVWQSSWLFAGFTFQIPNTGDYFTYQIGDDSIIVIRNESGGISALYNACRHRGSRICTKEQGRATRLVCPYHQWTYGPDGRLLRAKWMEQDSFKPENFGLARAKAEEIDGLIWISLSDNPPPFGEARPVISNEIKPHTFHMAKVAHVADYDINANWKLVYENNRDCYHCYVGHPEYIKANYDTAFIYVKSPDGSFTRKTDPTVPDYEEIEKYMDEKTKEWQEMGLPTTCSAASSFPGSGWYRASRTPLRMGFVTESIDGQPVSNPLLGDFTKRDVGSMRVHTLPNFWIHASGDHAVATRLTPAGPQKTKARVWWIVHRDAKEGIDYTLDKLLPIWQKTSEQDWYLCELNQQGVNSSHHTPGIYSEKKEAGVDKFTQWYIKKMRA